VHAELGPHYDGAVAESLVERIGAEIDRRVDARLGHRAAPPEPRERPEPSAPQPRAARPAWGGVVLGLGSTCIAAIVTAKALSGTTGPPGRGGQDAVIVFLWLMIAIINVAYNRRR
jgi:hypothetical protein